MVLKDLRAHPVAQMSLSGFSLAKDLDGLYSNPYEITHLEHFGLADRDKRFSGVCSVC